MSILKILSRFRRFLIEAYASFSLEALGVFRIAFGIVHCADLVRRWPVIELMYTNDGVLSNHYLLFRPPSPHYFSLLSAFSTRAEVTFFFAALFVCTLMFTLGYRTRLFHVLCALGFISIHNRNILFEYGGDVVSNIFWVLTVFMPLGARSSVDALRAGREEQSTLSRFRSAAVTLCIVQVATIYFFNAFSKSGPTWVEGSAIYYTLLQDRAVTGLGAWMVQNVPYAALQYFTWGARILEYAIAALIVVPWYRGWFRTAAVASLWSLHAGIALCLNLGVFSPLMMSISLLLLEGRAAQRLSGAFTALLRPVARIFPQRELLPPPSRPAFLLGRETLACVLGYCLVTQAFQDNQALRNLATVHQPSWVQAVIGYPRLLQGWSLFAPDAPRFDGWLVIDLTMRSGEHFDPQTGKEPQYLPVRRDTPPWSQVWDSYSLRLSFDRNRVYRYELERWIRERGKGLHPFNPAEVLSYQVWWVMDESPPPGRPSRGIIRKDLLFEGRIEARG